MSASHKLKWKRTLNMYKFLKEELRIMQTMNKESAASFQLYYEGFLQQRNIDLHQLNQENQDRIREAYGIEKEISGDVPVIEASAAALVACQPAVKKSDEVQLSEDEIVIHNSFSKLFKNIALKIHPDKIDPLKHDFQQRRKMSEDFKRANRALEEREYFILIEIAEMLDIPLPKNYNQQTRWMKSQAEQLNVQIGHEKNTYNYAFSEAETDEHRDDVIRKFINQLFGINL